MIVKKQMLAIRKLALKNLSQSPEHFGAVILAIDIKLKEMDDEELMDALALLEEVDEFNVKEIAS